MFVERVAINTILQKCLSHLSCNVSSWRKMKKLKRTNNVIKEKITKCDEDGGKLQKRFFLFNWPLHQNGKWEGRIYAVENQLCCFPQTKKSYALLIYSSRNLPASTPLAA